MRLWISLCIIALICPRLSLAESSLDLIEKLPTGCINWTKGVVEAKAVYPRDVSSDQHTNRHATVQTNRPAVENLMLVLKQLRMDAGRRVAEIMATHPGITARIRKMAAKARVVREIELTDGSREITVQFNLLGGFAQLMLPEGIRQVEAITPMGPKALQEPKPAPEGVYTGLVVDARGIGGRPAMVPCLYDESGKQVYGPAFVSREYVVQYGTCEYVREFAGSNRHARVGAKPLFVKGLHTLLDRSCDFIISNADAAKLRDASAHLNFLKQCRVVVILDDPL